MLSGVNIEFTKSIQEASGIETIASGGLKDMSDIKALIDAGIDGTIVGKAFYEGTLDLAEAFKVANNA
jgi:phosphoribosylformimino-5-aminoimidazole carboxamide ribotide isomerase